MKSEGYYKLFTAYIITIPLHNKDLKQDGELARRMLLDIVGEEDLDWPGRGAPPPAGLHEIICKKETVKCEFLD